MNLTRKILASVLAVAVVGTQLVMFPYLSSSAETTPTTVSGDVYPFGEYGYVVQQNITAALQDAQAPSHGWQGQYYNGTAWTPLEKMINDGNRQIISDAAATAGAVTGNTVGETGGFYAPGFRSTTGCKPKLVAAPNVPVAMCFTAPQDGTYTIPENDSNTGVTDNDLDAGRTVAIDSPDYGNGKDFEISFANNTDANKKATVKILVNNTVVNTYTITGGTTFTYSDLTTKAFDLKTGDVLRFAVYNNDASTTFADNKEAQVQITSELKYSPPAIQGNDTRSTACDISTFKIGDVVGTISDTNISVSVPFGTNVTNVTPVVTVSAGATFTPSGAVDFTNPVIFTVTSEDKLTTKTFTVTIIVQSATSSSSSSSTPTSSASSVTSTASSTSTDNTVTPPNTGDSIPAAAVLMLLIGAAGVVVCKKKK